MNRTTQNLLTWAPLGAGLALMLSDHRRLGVAMALVSPVTVVMEHPRGTRKALKAIPKSLRRCGKATGKAMAKAGYEVGHGAKEAGKSLRWLAS